MKKGKKALVLMLSVFLMFSMFPASAFAEKPAAPESAPAEPVAEEPAKEAEPAPQETTPAEPVQETAAPAESGTDDASTGTETPASTGTDNAEETELQEEVQTEKSTEASQTETEIVLNEEAVSDTPKNADDDMVTVTFNATEGTFSDGSQTKTIQIKKGDYIREKPESPTCADPLRGLRGWVSETDYNNHNWGNYYAFNNRFYPINEDTTIYAVWGCCH